MEQHNDADPREDAITSQIISTALTAPDEPADESVYIEAFKQGLVAAGLKEEEAERLIARCRKGVRELQREGVAVRDEALSDRW